jgi:hypothetical protein
MLHTDHDLIDERDPEQVRHAFRTPEAIRNFVVAGDAIVTLESERTHKHYTYRVQQAKDRSSGEPQPRWFVKLLTGPDNESSYSYIGMLDHDGFKLTRASKLPDDAPPVAGFRYLWRALHAEKMPCQMVVRHENRCGRCARTLTVPSSIDAGLGPDCRAIMGL